ncbi:uncharacterized protein BO96DRAFT_349458 [Aspergillus niger CBS 101883]|uniref:Uncharacterized protein n=2 Tax=Aspergillus niger TaxID=5061 RepID=A2R6C4_ASPNC|nr:uncharacterized protein BO96DRAFT_349458 [Aspergillus niger CBS 101883]XP_059605589.1 hypothetical protein An15g07400 [Aspergillus niger]PYH51679.1 hypothetical protein BO96DRAFT_349458 [Aspergillus niger CBS 101883]CAK48574.1 hypothetical protein An15g07400 [Aspergillus niger]
MTGPDSLDPSIRALQGPAQLSSSAVTGLDDCCTNPWFATDASDRRLAGEVKSRLEVPGYSGSFVRNGLNVGVRGGGGSGQGSPLRQTYSHENESFTGYFCDFILTSLVSRLASFWRLSRRRIGITNAYILAGLCIINSDVAFVSVFGGKQPSDAAISTRFHGILLAILLVSSNG